LKVNDKHFILEKTGKYLREDIGPSRYTKKQEIGNWSFAEYSADDVPHSYEDFLNIPSADFKSIEISDRWGGYDRTAWFKTTFEIEEGFFDPTKTHCFRLVMGQSEGWGQAVEGLVFVDGKAIQGVDSMHYEVFLDDEILKKGKVEIAVKVWSGLAKNPKFRVFGETILRQVHPASDEFYYLGRAIVKSIPLLGENDLKKFKLMTLLKDSFKFLNFLNPKSDEYYESVEKALAFLKAGLKELQLPEVKPTVYAVGHSHIDMAWLWRLSATREKASRTFSTVLNLMREYPDYIFMHSSPQLYKFLEEDYPEIFARVNEKIKSGDWEATGGMWVESDTNVPSGESLVRQFIYGKRYLKDKFGVDSKVLWLPDVFGYSAALPQIAKKSGIEYFMTTKISWNQYNHFPYDTFNWRGIDGSELFTHFITTSSDQWFYTYNGQMLPEEIPGIWKNYKQKDLNSDLLLSFGHGDGGGGPTREMLETRRAMEDIPGIPYVKTSKVEPYFKKLGEDLSGKALEAWDGELYFEYHRGTYTSQGYNKKSNRKMEYLLHDGEFLNILYDLTENKNEYPKVALDEMWERVLLLQFHDIIPGTSIKEVYEDSKVDYEKLLCDSKNIVDTTANKINNKISVNKDSVVVYNTLSWMRTAEVFVPFSDLISDNTVFYDGYGREMNSQKVEGGLLVLFEHVPAYGYKTFKLGVAEDKDAGEAKWECLKSREDKTIDTPFYKVKFNDCGEITSLYDEEAERFVGKDILGRLEAFEDKPLNFDAWDIDVFYKEKPYNNFKCTNLVVSEYSYDEVIRAVVRRTLVFNNSEITQDIIFYNDNRRIDFKTKVDWKEKQVLLKASFPVDIRTTDVTYDIQFGHIKRPNHSNNERDFAQFEVCGHKWADLSDGDYGVALLNDCKYGYDCKGSVVRLTLLKSAINPDETADQCEHEFSYALYPHLGSFNESDVQEAAAEFNAPALVYELKKEECVIEQVEFSLLTVSSLEDNVVIDTIKRAEDDNTIIIRVFENANKLDNSVEISLNDKFELKEVVETNLLEEKLEDISVQKNSFTFSIKPFEIKTFKLTI